MFKIMQDILHYSVQEINMILTHEKLLKYALSIVEILKEINLRFALIRIKLSFYNKDIFINFMHVLSTKKFELYLTYLLTKK